MEQRKNTTVSIIKTSLEEIKQKKNKWITTDCGKKRQIMMK